MRDTDPFDPALEREGASLWAQAKPGLASGFARPDDLALAAYLDGRLDEAGRDRVEAALAADDRLLELALAAAAALGAIAGGLWQTFGHYGERLAAKLRGHRELTVDDAILRIVALRQRSLLVALDGRGHAAVKPIELDAGREGAAANADPVSVRWRKDALPEAIGRARAHPEWAEADGSHKDEAIAELARALA